MLIDAHINITHNGRWFNTGHDASLERLLDEMACTGVSKGVLIAMPGATSNQFIAETVERHSDTFRGLGHLDFSGDVAGQIDDILAMGLAGIKIHPRFQRVNICDPQFTAMWEHLNAKGATVLVDGYYAGAHPGLLLSHLLPLSYESHIQKYSEVKFILAHAGAHRVLDTFFMCRGNANFFTDLSYSLSMLKGTSCYQDFRYLAQHADRKALFGSDFPEISLMAAKEDFASLTAGLAPETVERITAINALQLFWEKV